MKKTILISVIFSLLYLVPAFSNAIFSPDADRLREIIDVMDYENYYYDDMGRMQSYIDIQPLYYSSNTDLLVKAVSERNEEAVEIILPHLDEDYDFFKEIHNDKNATYNLISLARRSGSPRIRTMIYDAALPAVAGKYNYHYDVFVEQFDKNKDFLTYVLSKNTRSFKVDDNYDYLVTATIEKGNVPLLQFLLENGLNPSEVHLLSYLAQNGGFNEEISYETKKEIIDLLLAYGDSIDILPLCKENNRYDFFDDMKDVEFQILMLEKGMPIDLVKQDCLCSLLDHYSDFVADDNGCYLVSLLIKAGANVNYIEKSTGKSVLYKACWVDNEEANIVKLLLENGATTKVTFKQRITDKYPVVKALWTGNYEAIKAMKEHGLKLKGKRTLYAAASSPTDSVECLKLVLEDNKRFDKRDFFGVTAFWWAAWRCNPKIMNYLKELGANINVKNRFTGQTGIMAYFIDCYYFDLDEILGSLNVGIDLSIKDKKGKTLRDYVLTASLNFDDEERKYKSNRVIEEIDRILSASGYDIKPTAYDAILTDNNDVLENLLTDSNERAKINVADSQGMYLIDYAITRKNCEAVGILCKNGSIIKKQMIKDAITDNNIEMIEAFFANGININISLSDGDNINDAESLSETPLAYAIQQYCTSDDTLRTLLKFNPNLSLSYNKSEKTPKGYNILYYVVENFPHTKNELLLTLMDAGADPFYSGYVFLKEYLNSYDDDKKSVLLKIIDTKGYAEKLYDENGYFLGEPNNFWYYDQITQEKLLKGKIMTVTENLNLRNLYSPDRGYEEGYYEDIPEIICTIKAGSKVKVLNILNKEEIEGMNKFWVEVEITEDARTVNGEPVETGTTGRCYSGYLKF